MKIPAGMPSFDLWGDPIPPQTETRGRPAHEATDEKRKRVRVLRALGQGTEEIAVALGIPSRTLRRYYRPELRGGMAQLRAAVLVHLYAAVEAGNVAAIKEFVRLAEKADLVPTPDLAVLKPRRLGKKEQAIVDARTPDVSSDMGFLMSNYSKAQGKLH